MRRAAIATMLFGLLGCGGGGSGASQTAPTAPQPSTGDAPAADHDASAADAQDEARAQDEAPAEPCELVERQGYAVSAPRDTLVRLRVRAEVETGDTLGICPGDPLMTGDVVYFQVETTESARVALLHVGPDGSRSLLRGEGEEPLDGELRVPDDGGFPLDETTGDETFVLVASREPLAQLAPDLAEQLSEPLRTGGALGDARGEAGVDVETRTVHAAPDAEGVVVIRFPFRHLESGSLSGSRGVMPDGALAVEQEEEGAVQLEEARERPPQDDSLMMGLE